MVKYYSPDTVQLQQAELGDEEYSAIGRLIRACADIEDLVTLSVADLLGTSEAAAVVALGQTPLSKKLAIATYLAGTRSADWLARFSECFGARRSRWQMGRWPLGVSDGQNRTTYPWRDIPAGHFIQDARFGALCRDGAGPRKIH
jgi:hypothetical protein